MRIGIQKSTTGRAFFWDSCRGAAAAEFAILVPFLTLPLLSMVDLGYYAYQRMQVGNAALAGAEEARSFCNTSAKVPATSPTACPGFNVDEALAIHSTSLGNHVTLVSGYPLEGYYCTLTTGALQLVSSTGTIGSPPTGAPVDCSGVTGASAAGAKPGDYIQVQVTYTYTSVFPGMTVAALLPGTITQTSWSRLQ